jgi:membrane-bound ClpP family serine protease
MSERGAGAAVAAGCGVGFLLAGVALLLQEMDMLTLRWSLVLPLVVATAGLVVLLTGLTGAHRTRDARAVDESFPLATSDRPVS